MVCRSLCHMIVIGFAGTSLIVSSAGADVRLPVVRGDAATGPNVLQNSAFEDLNGDRCVGWANWETGYEPAPGEGRDGSVAAKCVSVGEAGQHGASQTVILNQTAPSPIIVRGWSKAEDVSGAADRDYALYCDLSYTDGTPLWGQATPISVGAHDWEQVEVLIIPAKPVASLTLHCLFRGHSGTVWFDDVQAYEIAPGEGTAVLDGVPVMPVAEAAAGGGDTVAGGGVSLAYSRETGRVAGLTVDGAALPAGAGLGGWLVRDVAAESDFHGFSDGRCEALGLELDVDWTGSDQDLRLAGTLRDTTGEDRAITLVLALPLDADGAEWGSGIRGGTSIGIGEYSTAVPMGSGATGTISLYPFSCVTTPDWGLALGVDINQPCQYRLAYNADTQQYFAAFDFGLVPDTANSPSAASFGLILYEVDPEWGFRSAAERYYTAFPEAFACVSKQQGIWMPFSKISEVEGWQDFGFRYKEGNDETTWDDANDILTFRYTEPSTWWMSMPPEMPRTYEAAMAEAQRLAAEGNTKARALLNSGLFDAQGRYVMQFLDTPWCDGAVFSMSALPGVEGGNDPEIGWNDEAIEQLYGTERNGDLDGEYLDSLEGYVTSDLDFRRDHFRVASRPLTFTMTSHQPVIHKGLAVDEFVEWIAADVHGMDKLMMANAVPHRFTFLSRHLDVMGTETNWLWQGTWGPMGHETMSMIRTMCAQKPYLFLMNTDFEALDPYVERYFQRCLLYGMYPSMFSPTASSESAYWQTPEWHNRDRDLHRQYQPIIRQVAEAGWQPLTRATTGTPDILVERFGPNEAGESFITVFNDGATEQRATIRVDAALVGIGEAEATELVSGAMVPLQRPDAATVEFEVVLTPEACAAIKLVQ